MIQETFAYNDFFAGNVMPVVTEKGTAAENQNIAQYALVELNASNQIIFPTGTIDVTKVYAIAAEGVTTGAGETKPITIYLTGEFNEAKIVIPVGKTIADYKIPLRKLGIFLKSVQ